MLVEVPYSVIEGIDFMFAIIDVEVGDRLDYMSPDENDKFMAVADWYRKLVEARKCEANANYVR